MSVSILRTDSTEKFVTTPSDPNEIWIIFGSYTS